jgi:hypothetical protein
MLARLAFKKALEATLIDAGVPFKEPFRKTHDLVALLRIRRVIAL